MAFVLAMVVTAGTGCGDEDSKQKTKGETENVSAEEKEGGGRFLESEIKLPKGTDEILAMKKLSDGSVEIAGQNSDTKELMLLKSKNGGKDWKKTKISGMKREAIAQAAIAPDGKIFLRPWGTGKARGKIVESNGKSSGFSFELPAGKEDNQIRQAYFDKDGDLIALDSYGSLLKIGRKDRKCYEPFDTNGVHIQYISVVGEVLLAVHEDGVLFYDTTSGEQLQGEGVLDEILKKDRKLCSRDTDSGAPMVFCEGSSKEQYLFANTGGIYHFFRGGSVAEQLADGSLTSLGSGNITLIDMAALDDSHILVAMHEGKKDKVFQYSYDKNASSVPNKELTVYALDESTFLRQAVTLFQKNHPDTYVKLEFGITEKSGMTVEDALSALNTDILAGKGPDVLILDGMPLDSYIEKGVLEDISDVVGEIDKKDGIFGNIVEGSKKNGKIYAMPIRVLIPVVLGDDKVVEAGGSLSALAERAETLSKSASKNVIPDNKGTKSLLRDCYYADSGRWRTEGGALDQEAVKDYLTQVKRLYDIDKNAKKNDNLGDDTWGGDRLGTCFETGLITGEWNFSFGTMAGMYQYQKVISARKQTKADIGLMNGDRVKTYIPYLLAGVTAGGNNVEMAKEFVGMLLGKEAGLSDSNGFSVNKAAFEELCREKMHEKIDTSLAFSGPDEKIYDIIFIKLKQTDVDKLQKMMESLGVPCITDRVIQELVIEQGDRYLSGEQNMDETVDAIMKKVNLYLAE